MTYSEIFETFPPDLRLPIARLVDTMKEELGVKRTDFEDLKTIVKELAQAQQRTEIRLEELAQAQQRTETRLEELAQAQQRTETQLGVLPQAQQKTDSALTRFERTFTTQMGGLGSRWGLQTKEAFRQEMRTILQDVGFTTERFLTYDDAAEVFGHPEQIELDVVIKNGKVIVIEIKSSLDRGNTYLFDRKVAFYARHSGRHVDRKLIVTPYADTRAIEVSLQLGIEVCTDVATLQ